MYLEPVSVPWPHVKQIVYGVGPCFCYTSAFGIGEDRATVKQVTHLATLRARFIGAYSIRSNITASKDIILNKPEIFRPHNYNYACRHRARGIYLQRCLSIYFCL